MDYYYQSDGETITTKYTPTKQNKKTGKRNETNKELHIVILIHVPSIIIDK